VRGRRVGGTVGGLGGMRLFFMKRLIWQWRKATNGEMEELINHEKSLKRAFGLWRCGR
jgi:hypothetical protein